ncbi:nucleolar protein 14 [Cokeromyces recurvatus]|uniref:nucleolar protein 14 n=1 Tax=Cokeromyces recurvatus TaxID=90255 RepID=UPI00221FC02A|nr:nucleolar protein 14 [Cokeromyces recurvatus]KAI7905544.1 nucleolar protein 14 [Cokeromyces recurvatus]
MVATKQQAPKGSGGSALKRLKKSLQAAGLVGPQSKANKSKKDRKRGAPKEVGKNDADKKLSLIRGEFNPFEQKTQKTKFEILGRKMKGTSGKPTLSKQIGEENRKKTLLVEMKNKHRQGGIIDKRFGENNPFLTPEEKMLERFTKEKQKASKGSSLFNLDDDEEFSLTHYGQSLSTMDDFDDAGLGLSDDDDDQKQMDAKIVSKMHFGGFDDDQKEEEGQRHKSKNEIMKEIIAKSKMHKLERQAAKQEDDELRETLDDELNDIRGLLETKPARKPLPSQSALFKKAENENAASAAAVASKYEQSVNEYSDYDKAIHELALDQRAQATDRTKTEEEIALEEKEKLEKAERARKRRMEGLDSESEDEHPKKGSHKKRKGAPQGDDLDDDYLEELEDEVDKLGKGLTLEEIQNAFEDEDEDEEEEEEEEEDDDDDDESEGEGEDESESEEEGDEDEGETDNEDLEDEDDELPDFGEDDGDDMNEIGANGIVQKKKKATPVASKTTKREIPYTFECPTSHDEFLEIMQDLDVEDCLIVIKRIRVLYHIKLVQENKAKLAQFLEVLVDHIAYVASTVSPMPTHVLEKLSIHIFEMAQQLPEAADKIFVGKLKKMQGEMAKKMKHTGSSWPDVEDMTLLRLIGHIFSVSDLTHPIATPALLFMCHALSQCRVETEIDIGRGLFLTLLTFEYQTISKRFMPECINFLNRCLILLSPKEVFSDKHQTPGYSPFPDRYIDFSIEDYKGNNMKSVSNLKLEQLVTESDLVENKDERRLSLLQGALRMIERYIQLNASTPAFLEVFESTLEILQKLANLNGWHSDIESLLMTLSNRLEKQIRFCKEKRIKTPLRMQNHRPIPIAQHLPKFENAYSIDRHYDPDHERAQARKLEAQLKKEKKGALRELRKDNQFIARERAKERKQKDEEYNKMVKGVMSLLEGEQAELKRLYFSMIFPYKVKL